MESYENERYNPLRDPAGQWGSGLKAATCQHLSCWLSSISDEQDIQQLVPVQALLSKIFQGVCHE